MKHKTIAPYLAILFLVFTLQADAGAQSRAKSATNSVTVPFQSKDRLILVNARVGKQEGLFILDTGMPELILNSDYFHFGEKSHNVLHDFAGRKIYTRTGIYSLYVDDFKFGNRPALIADLSHMEQHLQIKLLGIIGFNVLKSCELTIDYPQKKLSFSKLGRKRKLGDNISADPPPSQIIAFDLFGHLPCLVLNVGKESLQVGLDSGSTINTFDLEEKDRLMGYAKESRPIQVNSLYQKSTFSHAVFLEGISMSGIPYPPMRTTFKDLKRLNDHIVSGKKVQGLLGYEFLRHHKIAIHYGKRELRIWEKQATYFAEQYDLLKPQLQTKRDTAQ